MARDNAAGTHCHALMQISSADPDPQGILRLIPLKPFSSRKRGESLGPPRPGHPTPLARWGGVSYSTHEIVGYDINDHLRYLLNAILPVSEQLETLVDRNQMRWRIVLFIDNAPADWRSLVEKPIADTLDKLGIELILDDPSTITVVEEKT